MNTDGLPGREWENEPWYAAAWALVQRRHGAASDRLGRPMVEHFRRVARILGQMFPHASRSQVEAALLHDAFEPGGFEAAELEQAGITPEALGIIRRITLPTDGRSYLEYSRDLAASGDIAALEVKLADNADAFALFGALGGEEGERRIREQYVPSREIMRQGLQSARGPSRSI